jgi:hypothetical protein
MADWIRHAQGATDAIADWEAFQNALQGTNASTAKQKLKTAANRLKTYVEKTWEAKLTAAELAEKEKNIELLIKAIPATELNANNSEDYKRALVAKVVGSRRYLQSIKGKNPYVENRDDDDDGVNGFNAQRIRTVVDRVRKPKDLRSTMIPGENLEWSKWRGLDCVCAAIIKVSLGNDAPTDEERDQSLATALAGHLNIARGPLADPVLLHVMEQLGWPHARWDNWAAFQTGANASATYVISYDTTLAGTQSHVVVASNSNGWNLYDRQGVRLNRAANSPPVPNNPLDSWEVTDTEAAQAVRAALS